MTEAQLRLKGFDFCELRSAEGLERLDRRFLDFLERSYTDLYAPLLQYRENADLMSPEAVSALLISSAQALEAFIAELFDIENAVHHLQQQTLSHDPIFAFKTYFVLKHARRNLAKADKNISFNHLNQWLNEKLLEKTVKDDRQLAVAQLGLQYLNNPSSYAAEIDTLIQWCVAAMVTEDGRRQTGHWEMFHLPKPLDFQHLVPIEPLADDPVGRLKSPKTRFRDGFNLTDPRMTQREAMSEVHYCVYCHKNSGDFCSRGFPVKKGYPAQGFKINFAGDTLTGCPLEEKISEMHVLKRDGFSIGALAMIMVDNPLCPLTGHRICNDCMKSCIYQKQEPVDIPQTETRILTDVLHLPWGVEIYDLLTRWNPLRQKQWVMKPYNGLKILVMGLGPAGVSLSHHLLMEGFAVAGADGLKIEPLPAHYLDQPIYRYETITENLSDRVMAGFGGVAEYGITVRWDKNFLKLVYLTLMRRPLFQTLDNVRFGGTLTVEDAWQLGFDHLAVAVGAGLPKELPIPGSLAPGMRQANDFLMALQLTGAAQASSVANLQVRLPAVVIGGGLTAVDTATEVQAYYLVQIEKMARRYAELVSTSGEKQVRSRFLKEDIIVLDEFLKHAEELAAERRRAQQENRLPDLISLLHRWGGVTLAYRRRMQDSPAYRGNYAELDKALEEGIYYAENLEPQAALLDEAGQVRAMQFLKNNEKQILPARSIFIATGARLNVAYEFEHRGTFLRHDRFEYARYEREEKHLRHVDETGHVKNPRFGAFTSYEKERYRVTFLGDTHPVFSGSVVNAIASGQRVYPEICRLLSDRMKTGDRSEYAKFRAKIAELFHAQVVEIRRHNPKVVELIVRAPQAARNGGSGQFYRLQNYASSESALPQMEALALLGVKHPHDPDMLSFFVVERGGSSRWVQRLNLGEPISVMGPTGARSALLPPSSSVLIIGDIFSPAFFMAMSEKFRAEGHRVSYIAYLEDAQDIYCQSNLEEIAERIVWVSARGKISTNRPQDRSYTGDLQNALKLFSEFSDVQHIWVIGSSCLLHAIKDIRPAQVPVTASVYGPMQCMLKGVCAQCLQWQIDPITGQRTKAVYACSWQHQPLEKIDIHHIDERLSQNRCQETLTALWLEFSMLFQRP